MKQIVTRPEEYWYRYNECPSCKGSFRYQFEDGYYKKSNVEIYNGDGLKKGLRYIDCPICGFPCRHSHATKEIFTQKQEERLLTDILANDPKTYPKSKGIFSLWGFIAIIFIICMLIFIIGTFSK